MVEFFRLGKTHGCAPEFNILLHLPTPIDLHSSPSHSLIMVLAAVGQFCATASLAHNAKLVASLVHKASQAGARVLFLPEASDYIAGSPAESVSLAESVESSPVIASLRQALAEIPEGAVKPEVSIGVHEPGSDGKRIKNTLLWFDTKGELKQRYQKIHLFDVEIANGPILKESRAVEPGNEVLAPFDSPIGKSKLSIWLIHSINKNSWVGDLLRYQISRARS